MSGAYLYILRCADRSYYVGTTRKSVEERIAEHNAGLHGGYTAKRRPVTLAFAQHFENHYRCHRSGTSNQGMVTRQEGGANQRGMESVTGIGKTRNSERTELRLSESQ